MKLRRFWWLTTAFVRRHPLISFAVLVIIASSATLLRSSYSENLTVTVFNLLSQSKYTEGLVGTPKTFNPLFVTSDSEKDLSRLLFRGLTKTTLSGDVTGDLAESWEISSGGQTYLFHLRSGERFQNGDTITASDVAFTYEAAKNKDTGSQLGEAFKDMDIQVVSDKDIIFRRQDTFAPFLSLTDLGILPKKLLEKISPRDLRFAKFNTAPTGSGKFRFKSLSSDEVTLTFGKTDYIFRFYKDQDALVTALKLGEVKAAGVTQATNFKDYPALQILSSPLYRRYVGIFYNERGGATGEKGVRQALSYSVNKDKLIKETLSGAGEAAFGPLPPISWAAASGLRRYDYSVGQAKATLDKASWTGGPVRSKEGKLLEITISFRDREEFRKLANAVAFDWAEVGVRAILNPLSGSDFQTKVIDGKDFQAAIFTQEIPIDPDQYVLWHTTQVDGANITGMKLPKLDKALEDGRRTIVLDERKAKYADFQRFLLDESPVTFLYYPKYSFIVSTKVQGIELKPLGVPSDRFSDIERWKILKTFL